MPNDASAKRSCSVGSGAVKILCCLVCELMDANIIFIFLIASIILNYFSIIFKLTITNKL